MVHHLVFWRVKEEAAGLNKTAILQKMKCDLEGLNGVIPEIEHLSVGINQKESEFASDIALSSRFQSWEALATYAAHPAHQEVVAFVKDVVAERRVVDWED